MITVKEIAWLAGILEGEGSFAFNGTPKIAIKMTDEDVIKKVASLFNRKYHGCSQVKYYKQQYVVYITGTAAIEWMFTIYSLMGIRRKERINEIVKLWKPIRSWSRKGLGSSYLKRYSTRRDTC